MGHETPLKVPSYPRSHAATPQELGFYDNLIEQLKAARRHRMLSQAALDDLLGVSEGLTAKWESKARLPGAFFLMCWCEALGVTLVIEELQ